jgi:hypothetical protein
VSNAAAVKTVMDFIISHQCWEFFDQLKAYSIITNMSASGSYLLINLRLCKIIHVMTQNILKKKIS